MKRASNIQYLSRAEINTAKWDQCIDHAGGFPLYAYHFYLDAMCRHWDALVLNDYEAVMPLNWNKKWGIYYLYQPFLTLQTGIIGATIDKETVQAFLISIPDKFRFWEINLNKKNVFSIPDFELEKRQNYTLSLQQPYSAIAHQYRQNLERNIKKAKAAGCVYKEGIPVQDILHLAEPQLKQYTRLLENDLTNFATLIQLLLRQQKAQTVGVYYNNLLCAACIFLVHQQRVYYILAANHAEGKRIGASHFLLDHFIQRNAGQQLTLDFTGSDIPSIAFFYECFGAQQEAYTSIRMNRLPFWLKWLKQ